MNLETTRVVALACAIGISAGMASAALPGGLGTSSSESSAGGAAEAPYSAGQRALDAGDYDKAATLFRDAVDKGAEPVDAALYWLAYAQSKAGRRGEALATVQRLKDKYPKSGWMGDARTLEVSLRGKTEPPSSGAPSTGAPGSAGTPSTGAPGSPGAASSDDEELKLYALQSLQNADPERAVPTIQRFLSKPHSQHLEEQALFVLSQADSPRAKQLLSEIALGNQHPQLRLKAIECLGISGDEDSRRLLSEVYSKTSDVEVKKKVLDGFMMSDDKARVLEAARSEPSPELRGKAIELLGVLDATPELRQLYRSEKAPELRRRIIDAFIVAGDADGLIEIARSETDPDLRQQAVRNIGLVGGDKASAALREIYRSSNDAAVKNAVLEAFFVGDDAKSLVEVAKGEKDRELRRAALQKLSQMDSPEALDFLGKQLDE
jgi:HEAT repeat protein